MALMQEAAYPSLNEFLLGAGSVLLLLIIITALIARRHIPRGPLKLSSLQGCLAYLVLGAQFLWALPMAALIIWAVIVNAVH